jgi:phage protein D
VSGDLFYRVSVDASGAGCDISEDLVSLAVEQQDGRPDQLSVELSDPYKVLSHALQEGMDVEVELGTDDDHGLVFRGRIYKVDGKFPLDGVPTINLRAYDRSMKMGLKKRNRPFRDKKLSEIVSAVAQPYFNKLNIDVLGDPKFVGNGLRQDEQTDLCFLQHLAQAYGCVMYVKPGDQQDTLHFVAQKKVMTTQPDVTLFYGRADVDRRLIHFESSSDVAEIRLPRVLSGVDFDLGKAVEVTTSQADDVGNTDDPFKDENLTAFRKDSPVKSALLEGLISAASATQAVLRQELGNVEREAVTTFATAADLAAIAKNQFSTSLRGMRASGQAIGARDLWARSAVDIQDVGGRFSGIWYLSQVRHVLNREGYRSELQCQR